MIDATASSQHYHLGKWAVHCTNNNGANQFPLLVEPYVLFSSDFRVPPFGEADRGGAGKRTCVVSEA